MKAIILIFLSNISFTFVSISHISNSTSGWTEKVAEVDNFN